jgi:ATP-binding cassette subfamily B protein/subfamily B ATP-binding cassette protein MsbA
LLVSLILLFTIDWRLAIFSVLAIPLTFIFDNIISKKQKHLNNTNRENDQKMTSWLHASVQGWRGVKALNLYKKQEIKFVRFIHKYALYFGAFINYEVVRMFIIPKIKDEFFMRFGLYFLGGLLIIGGDLKIGDLLVFAVYYGMLSGAINSVSSTDAELQVSMPYTDRLIEELGKNETIKKAEGVLPDDSNIIEFRDVCFTYPGSNDEVLHNLNLQIEKGERLAIIGESGCGKTTALKLMTGMLEPTSGCVSFAGINLVDIDMSAMHKRFGFVMQENMLFNTTIKENLLYGKNNATDSELFDACKKAYIYDFICGLPEKLDTIIGERGIKLSGGQRQRLVLARLFLRNVDIFIFDEATNSLDQYSESIVYDAIYNIAKDKTIIIVAHRESSISLCNRTIILE